eukprot:5885158-Pyramimonas_sp.AAC.1
MPAAAPSLSEGDAAYLAAHPKARRAAPWVVERFRRQAAQGGQAAAVVTGSSTEEGLGECECFSDDEDVWWKQTLRGGAIARDGDPSGQVGKDPFSDVEFELTGEASQTSSPAAASSRRRARRMPLQDSSAPLP